MRNRETLWISIGLLLIAAALCLAGWNFFAERSAGIAADDCMDALLLQLPAETPNEPAGGGGASASEIAYPDYVLNPKMEMPVSMVNGRATVGVLSIPSLSLSLPVLSQWSGENGRVAPCRYSGTAYMGNLVICGHNYRRHFGPIGRLSPGEDVYFTDMDGNRFHYQVSAIEVLKPTAVVAMTESGYALTLFTCTLGGRTRLTVRCEVV